MSNGVGMHYLKRPFINGKLVKFKQNIETQMQKAKSSGDSDRNPVKKSKITSLLLQMNNSQKVTT